jgi:hypothetical protein
MEQPHIATGTYSISGEGDEAELTINIGEEPMTFTATPQEE